MAYIEIQILNDTDKETDDIVILNKEKPELKQKDKKIKFPINELSLEIVDIAKK